MSSKRTSVLAVGSYTRKEGHVPNGCGCGVSFYAFSTGEEVKLEKINHEASKGDGFSLSSLVNPSWVAVHRVASSSESEAPCSVPGATHVLLASQETGDAEGDALAVFSLKVDVASVSQAAPGTLVSTSGGLANCHIAVGQTFNNGAPSPKRVVGVSGYCSGSLWRGILDLGTLALVPLDEEAIVDAKVQYEGTGPNEARQEASHVHHSYLRSDGWALICDLGTDRVHISRHHKTLDPKGMKKGSQHYLDPPPGSGPRHLVFSPTDPDLCIVLCELIPLLLVCRFDGIHGELVQLGEPVPTLPKSKEGEKQNLPASILMHPSGTFIFVSNRFVDTVSVFRVSSAAEQKQSVAFVTSFPCGGATPRDMTLSPCGLFLLVANQDSSGVAVFGLHGLFDKPIKEGGAVDIPLQLNVEVNSPSCLQFF